jgi:DNA invertase Pin-like site-specific DNA recombinase
MLHPKLSALTFAYADVYSCAMEGAGLCQTYQRSLSGMAMRANAAKFVAYLRVSKSRAGKAALVLEAQREAVRQFVSGRGGKIIAPEFVEVESEKHNDRPELLAALKRCRVTGATLVVAKLDRLSRNAAFLMTLRDSGLDFVAADLPEANTMTVGVMAVLAQHEREAISNRTKAAKIKRYQRQGVEAAREKAKQAAELRRGALEALHGLSLNQMAARLNADSVTTSRGGQWTATAVKRALALLSA